MPASPPTLPSCVASLVTGASKDGAADSGVCGDFSGGMRDEVGSSFDSKVVASTSSSSCEATTVEEADGEGGIGAASDGTETFSLGLARSGFSIGEGCEEEFFSMVTGLGVEA